LLFAPLIKFLSTRLGSPGKSGVAHPHLVASLTKQFVRKFKLHFFPHSFLFKISFKHLLSCCSWQTNSRIYDWNKSLKWLNLSWHSYQFLVSDYFTTLNIVCRNHLTANIFNWIFVKTWRKVKAGLLVAYTSVTLKPWLMIVSLS